MSAPLPRLDPDERRKMILDVARAVFLEEGYATASMATIAARLGGSKGTLYKYFRSKEELFEAFVMADCAAQQQAMSEIVPEGSDVRGSLARMGRLFLNFVMSDQNVSFFRVVVAESERSPDLGRRFYESAVMGSGARVRDFLTAMAATGALQIEDPQAAAHLFLAMCLNRLQKARLCNVAPQPTPEEIEVEVSRAVDVFVRAFGAPGA